MKLIIDTDPGVDDAIAIALSKSIRDVELLGLTTIFGNTFVGQSSRNARFLLDLLDIDAMVFQGAALPYDQHTYTPSAEVHGDEGFGTRTSIPEIGVTASESAAAFLVKMARAYSGELVICAIGPLTNIADALKLDPDFATHVKQLVIMGGAYRCKGNITPYAEANIFHDPKAADMVFGSNLDIVMIGLDVTRKTLLRQAHFDEVATHSPKVGGFIAEITPFYLDFYRKVGGIDGCPMHDAAAVLACVHPDRFDFHKTGIEVRMTGERIGETTGTTDRKPVSVAIGVQAEWAVDFLLKSLRRLP